MHRRTWGKNGLMVKGVPLIIDLPLAAAGAVGTSSSVTPAVVVLLVELVNGAELDTVAIFLTILESFSVQQPLIECRCQSGL